MDAYESAHRHGIADADIEHAVDHAVLVAEDEDDKVLYLGPDRAGNLLEVVAIKREDDSEIVIHAMKMRRAYEHLLDQIGEQDD